MKAHSFQPRFLPGDRVRLSAHAIASGIRLQSRAGHLGTVVEQTSVLGVLVRPDGYKTTRGYHVDFWEHAR